MSYEYNKSHFLGHFLESAQFLLAEKKIIPNKH